ncbi:hypothetical protein [Chengkuizengella sediminis]|uniref:hypothetical protein n=1 Tax=Chengkuizengella sediminis TaxID=1885917 RepID=UPI00138991B8|nr:hypothetical protein [Chengkuizengella sediminis]NDI35896.1 hypothetical protein [Chengkuizengella sediminis]
MNSEHDQHENISFDNQETKIKHSGLGIASFIIGTISIVLAIVMFILLSMSVSNIIISAEPTEEEILELVSSQPLFITSILVLLIVLFIQIIGAIIGVISLFIKNRKKLFPILGTILNLLPILAIVVLLLLSLIIGTYTTSTISSYGVA